jgi:hypothetical protein
MFLIMLELLLKIYYLKNLIILLKINILNLTLFSNHHSSAMRKHNIRK